MYHAVCKEYIPGGDKMNNDQVDEYAATWSPMNRVGQPIDIARVVCFLASQDGEWVNGKVIGIGTFPLSPRAALFPDPANNLKDGAACM
jgi:tetrahydroxynaphthalene reductase